MYCLKCGNDTASKVKDLDSSFSKVKCSCGWWCWLRYYKNNLEKAFRELQEELKFELLKKTGCSIQHTGWTCGTCFYALSKDFTNSDWQTILFIRGDYKKKDLDNLPVNPYKRGLKILEILKYHII